MCGCSVNALDHLLSAGHHHHHHHCNCIIRCGQVEEPRRLSLEPIIILSLVMMLMIRMLEMFMLLLWLMVLWRGGGRGSCSQCGEMVHVLGLLHH